jgi:hypothetical protein
MARTKFTFEKRQREIARQKKQQEKATRRTEAKQQKSDIEPGVHGEELGVPDREPDSPES